MVRDRDGITTTGAGSGGGRITGPHLKEPVNLPVADILAWLRDPSRP